MKLAHVPATLWFGTDDSHALYLNALDRMAALEKAGEGALEHAIKLYGGGMGGDPFSLPPMWEMSGDTAIINIDGSLVAGQAGFMRLFGVIGYEDVKAAMLDAASQKEPPKRMVLAIDSGGGQVAGVDEAGAFIRQMAAERMPVFAWTGGTMGSAAYWMGVSADAVFSTRMALVGSVGTLSVHMDRSKQLADAGITAKVFRHGQFKALGHPAEPLTKAGESVIQGMVDTSGEIFVTYAAGRRGTTSEKFQKTMGEGRVFMGQQANEVGLTDGVMSLEETLAHIKTLDKQPARVQNSRQSARDSSMKIRAISKAVILAIAGGTKVEALGLSQPVANVEGTAPEAEDLTALTAEATEIQAAFTAATTKAVDAAVATVKATSDEVVKNLTAKVTLLEAGAGDLTTKVAAANETAASYAGIVKASCSVMSVALGGSADVAAALTGPALTAEHERLKTEFTKKFPKGGVAAVNATLETEAAAQTGPSPEFLAATASFRPKK